MAQINKENVGLLHDKLTITLHKDDYMPKVEAGLKKMAKTASMKGFRPGLVPVGMVRKMYGKEILADELSKTASAKLDEYLSENKVKFLGHPMSNPLKEAIDLETANDFHFVFDIGLQPDFQLNMPNGKSDLIQYKINVNDALLDKEISYEQTRHGKSEEVETIEGEDVLQLELKAESFEKNIHLLVSKIKNDDSRKQLIAMKKDETIAFDLIKAFNSDAEDVIHNVLNISHDEFDKINFAAMHITLKKIFRLNKAEANGELFDKVYPGKNITTMEAFKEELKKDLENVYARETERKANTDMQKHLVESTAMEFPTEFLKRWIQSVSKNPMTEEEVNAGFESFKEVLKWTLIKNRIIVENNLQVKEEDLKNKVMEYLREAYKGMDDAMLEGIAQRILSNEKETEYMVDNLINERVFNFLREKTTFNTKDISLEDFENLVNPHKHHHHH